MEDGLRYPPFVTEARWKRLREHVRLRKGDIVIATYPESGTTWMEQIILLLLEGGDASTGVGVIWLERYLDAEADNGPPSITFEEWEALPSPRVIKTHALPTHLIGVAPSATALPEGVSLIHVTREPRDAALSAYHHPAGGLAPSATGWPLDAFLKLWASEYHAHGSLARYACEWRAFLAAQHDDDDATLELAYEQLKRSPHSAVRAVARLLGLTPSDGVIERVVEASRAQFRRDRVESDEAAFPQRLLDELTKHLDAKQQEGRQWQQGAAEESCQPVAEGAVIESGDEAVGAAAQERGAAEEATLAGAAADSLPCSFKVLDLDERRAERRRTRGQGAAAAAEAELMAGLATELASASEPVLVRGAMSGWAAARDWRSSRAFEAKHGQTLRVRVGRGVALAQHGPKEALQLGWGGEWLSVTEFARARRLSTLPADAYVFFDVENASLSAELGPLTQLWDATMDARHAERRQLSGRARRDALRPSTRLGLGGTRSGVSFHLHGEALNANFYGRKLWWAYDDGMVSRLNASAMASGKGEPIGSEAFWRDVYPSAAFQEVWNQQEGSWQCVQQAGELVYLPACLYHATLNAAESLGVVLQLDTSAHTPLHMAAHRGDAAAVAELLALGADPHSRSRTGLTPLHLAAFSGHAPLVAPLLQAAAASRHAARPLSLTPDLDGTTPLHAAARSGSAPTTRALVASLSPSQLAPKDGLGHSPLHTAAFAGSADAADVLLEAGAHVDALDARGHTPLAVAEQMGHVRVVERLLTAGASEPLTKTAARIARSLVNEYMARPPRAAALS